MNAAREQIITALARRGGEVTDRSDAVRRLMEVLGPRWEKRDSLVHLLLDMERDGQIERERPTPHRTVAIRLGPAERERAQAPAPPEYPDAVREVVTALGRIEVILLQLQSAVLGMQAELMRRD